jgi:hypothetical protein
MVFGKSGWPLERIESTNACKGTQGITSNRRFKQFTDDYLALIVDVMVTATGRLQGLLIPQPVSKRSSMIGVGGETQYNTEVYCSHGRRHSRKTVDVASNGKCGGD